MSIQKRRWKLLKKTVLVDLSESYGASPSRMNIMHRFWQKRRPEIEDEIHRLRAVYLSKEMFPRELEDSRMCLSNAYICKGTCQITHAHGCVLY